MRERLSFLQPVANRIHSDIATSHHTTLQVGTIYRTIHRTVHPSLSRRVSGTVTRDVMTPDASGYATK